MGTKGGSRRRGWWEAQQLWETGYGRRKLHFQGTAHPKHISDSPTERTLPPPHWASGDFLPIGAPACNQQQTHALLYCLLVGAARCRGAAGLKEMFLFV